MESIKKATYVYLYNFKFLIDFNLFNDSVQPHLIIENT